MMVRVVYETTGRKIRSQLLEERPKFDVWTHSVEKGVIVIDGTYNGKCIEIVARRIMHMHIVRPEVSLN